MPNKTLTRTLLLFTVNRHRLVVAIFGRAIVALCGWLSATKGIHSRDEGNLLSHSCDRKPSHHSAKAVDLDGPPFTLPQGFFAQEASS